ncbi:GntR family transcriptional regulator, partial [Neobacillus niacini]
FLDSNDFESHIDHLIKQLRSKRDQIVTSLQSFLKEQVDFYIPEGGIHLWCRIKEDFNETQLLEESIRRGVIYVPGSTMGSEKGFVRFTFSRENEENIHEGIRRFSEALQRVAK